MKKFLLSFAFVSVAFASYSEARNVWRDCGIGAMLFKSPDYSWAAISSNIIWDLGSTATSSNMSSDDTCAGPKANTARFIQTTYANLEEQTATGSGEHLTAMLNLMGCENSAHNQIIENVRSDLKKSMSKTGFENRSNAEKAESYYNNLMGNIESKFTLQCHMS